MGRPRKNPQEPTPAQQLARAESMDRLRRAALHDIFLLALNAENQCERDDLCAHEAKAFFHGIRLIAESWS